jgi:septal ring factor EnvC (AmiA/AmiB activator)
MPRGVIRTDEDRIAEIDTAIAGIEDKKGKLQAKIDELAKQKQDIMEAQKQKKVDELLGLIEASGKTPDEIIAMVKEDQSLTA